MTVLNLGCGFKTSDDPDVVNLDHSPALRVRESRLLRPLAPVIFRGSRRAAFHALPQNIVACDLKKGIPYADSSVDLVYFSHLLEHLDRDVAPTFLTEVLRSLKPGGLVRIVVPDLAEIVNRYTSSYELLLEDGQSSDAWQHYDRAMNDLLEQSVRRWAAGTRRQKPLRRFAENMIAGGARRRGETHQWMYDELSLKRLLEQVGYVNVTREQYAESGFPGWDRFGLETNADGTEYKPNSLYMEGQKP